MVESFLVEIENGAPLKVTGSSEYSKSNGLWVKVGKTFEFSEHEGIPLINAINKLKEKERQEKIKWHEDALSKLKIIDYDKTTLPIFHELLKH